MTEFNLPYLLSKVITLIGFLHNLIHDYSFQRSSLDTLGCILEYRLISSNLFDTPSPLIPYHHEPLIDALMHNSAIKQDYQNTSR